MMMNLSSKSNLFHQILLLPSVAFKALHLHSYLDIDSNFTPTIPHENKRRVNRSRTLQSIIHKNKDNKAKKFLSKIPKIQSLYNSINRPYAIEDNVSNELREKLKNDLKPEISELSKLIGKDLNYWCQN